MQTTVELTILWALASSKMLAVTDCHRFIGLEIYHTNSHDRSGVGSC